MPKVSAVIPCYNHGRFLDQAVDSVLAQTFRDVEIIIVDDGSTDPSTVELLEDYPAERAKVLRTPNQKASAARNQGIRNARGEYILCLDADDWFAPAFLEKAVPILDDDPKAGAVTCYVEHFGRVRRKLDEKDGGGLKTFLIRNACHAGCLLRRRAWEEAGGFNVEMVDGYEDWDFWISVTEKGYVVRSIPEHLFHYRVAGDSRNIHADRKRPELVRQIVRNHLPSYRRYIREVVGAKEAEYQALNEELDRLRGSRAFRAGQIFAKPIGKLTKRMCRDSRSTE